MFYNYKFKFLKSCFVLAFLTFGFINQAKAQQPVFLADNQAEYRLGLNLEILEDPGGQLTIVDVTSPEYRSQFIPSQEEMPNFGYTDSVYWVRFTVRNESRNRSPWALELGYPNMDYVELYKLSSDGKVVGVRKTGNMRPIETRDHIYQNLVFLIMFSRQSEQTIYLRFQNEGSMTIPLILWSMSGFMQRSQSNHILFGTILGILLVMIGSNLFLFLSLKDRSYLYFALFVTTLLFFTLSYTGIAHIYLWPNLFWWNRLAIPVFIGFILISLFKFTDSFLQVKTRLPEWHKAINFLSMLLGLLIILTLITSYRFSIISMIISAIFSMLFILLTGFRFYQQGFQPAKYFLLGLLPLFTGASLVLLVRLDLIPSQIITEQGYLIGYVLLVWLMSQAQASRIKLLKGEKEKADKDLKESEEKFRNLAEQSPNMIFINQKGKIVYANQKCEEAMGYSIDEFYSEDFNFLTLIAPEDKEMVKENFRKHLKDKDIEPYEYSLVTKDGNKVLVILATKLIEYQGENAILGIVTDITERKQGEIIQQVMYNIAGAVASTKNMTELYQVIHSELSKLIDATNFFVGFYDEDTDTISLPYMKDEKDEIEKAPAAQTISAQVIKNNRPMLLREKDMDRLEKEGKIGRVGSPCKIWLGVPLQDDGKVIGIVVVQSYKDENAYNESDLLLLEFVSRQVAGSIKKKQAEEQIRILSRSIEQSPALVLITDLNGDIEYVNPKFIEVTGYSFDEVKGKNPRILKSGETQKSTYKELWDKITTGKEWQGEFHNRKKNGDLYWEYAYISPIKNERGEITHFLGLKEDITDQKKLQQQLIQSQKMEAIGTLAGGIAHDFNNILTVINGYSEFALRKLKRNKPIYKEISAIRSAGERAEKLTRQILAFSRKQIFQPQIIGINQIVSDSEKMMRRLIGEDINIKIHMDPDLPLIKADPGQIEQIIINLLVNARDAINQKTEKAANKKITIETGKVLLNEFYVANHVGSHKGLHVYLFVSDNGVGMTEELRQNIFDPFFTTKETGKGTGLGLATVYGIVKQNNGSIYVYSEPAKGTTFKIYWPSTDEKFSEIVSKEMREEDLYGKEVILFVEDNKEVSEFACTALKDFGYQVYTAPDGVEALELIKAKNIKIDFLVTDMVMPEMDGRELSEKIKEKFPDIYILFVSGYANNHIVHSGELEKGINFLQKPFSVHSLLHRIREILDKN